MIEENPCLPLMCLRHVLIDRLALLSLNILSPQFKVRTSARFGEEVQRIFIIFL